MAEFSNKLLNMLTEFLLCEIGSKALDGITYTMILKTPSDEKYCSRYKEIKEEATKCGYSDNEVFRVYELCNGYIFDMDISTTKKITAEIAKSLAKIHNEQIPSGDLIGDVPEKRRKKDLVNLAKYLKSEFSLGKKQVEVALFSRNSTNKIIIHGIGPSGDIISIKYNAYAIRHWDIEILNEKLLIPLGFRVSCIQPCEILPSKTGVSFLFTMENV